MNNFRFGLETEYILCDKNRKPLWWPELSFEKIYSAIEKIQFDDLPSVIELDAEEAHPKLMPFVVEGYHLKNDDGSATSMLPKGVEIRTPVCNSLSELFLTFETLYARLGEAMKAIEYDLLSLSHHPDYYDFYADRSHRRHDFWQWAMEVMTTYGPDINISAPQGVTEKLFSNCSDFEQKLNYYAPALTALSLSSPFYKGGLKKDLHGVPWKSVRTFRRSTIAPLIEWHANESNRLEFKFFEMTNSLSELKGYFLMCLGLMLSEELQGRALRQDGIYLMGEVSKVGLESRDVQYILSDFFPKAKKALMAYHFNPDGLDIFEQKMRLKQTRADHMLEQYQRGESVATILENQLGIIQ